MGAWWRSCGRVPRGVWRLSIFCFVGLMTVQATPAHALGTCGDVDCSGSISASDALAVLKKAVGGSAVVACPSNCGNGLIIGVPTAALVTCGDFNCTNSVTASDALSVLKAAVGVSVDLKCGPECAGVSTTTSTTLPPTNDEQAAVEVVNSMRAAANVFGVPTDVQNIHKLERLAAYTNILVDSDSAGTLSMLGNALESMTAGLTNEIDLSDCITFGSGNVSFEQCAIGYGTTFDGSVGGSGNTFTLDVTFTVATPFATTTITMGGSITVTTSAMTGTITLVTSTTSGQDSATSTVTVTFDVGLVNNCPTSGTVTTSYHVVEMEGSTTTRDDESSFTSTYGPNCGDVSFASNQTTTTFSGTTTTLEQSPYAPGGTQIITTVHAILDLATGPLDGDKLEEGAKMVDAVSALAGLDATGQLHMAAFAPDVRNSLVQPPDPGCFSRVGGTTTFTNCSIDFARYTFNGTLTVNGDSITVDMHAVDQAEHTREHSGTIAVTASSVSGSLSTINIQPAGIITNDSRTTLDFDVDLQSRCARGGTVHETYDNKALVGDQVATHATGDLTVTYGPACGQVAFN